MNPKPWLPPLPPRSTLLQRLADVGRAVEAAFGGSPQDVEGVWLGGEVTVVQARPQVIHKHAA